MDPKLPHSAVMKIRTPCRNEVDDTEQGKEANVKNLKKCYVDCMGTPAVIGHASHLYCLYGLTLDASTPNCRLHNPVAVQGCWHHKGASPKLLPAQVRPAEKLGLPRVRRSEHSQKARGLRH